MKAILLLLLSAPFTAVAQEQEINSVEPVSVETTAGSAPELPYQVWTTYADGRGEYRQVKWQNVSPDVEEEQARQPAGTQYDVRGYVLGDNSTANGYPITARVSVVARQAAFPRHPVAEPLPLGKVVIDGDNRLTQNRDRDIDHLLSLNPKQQLYNYHDTYGLPVEGFPVADGWDSPTTKLKGHGTGHYLSALAMAYASCQDAGKRAKLKDNLRLMVDEMRLCQERTFVWSDSLGRYFEARDLAPESELQVMGGTWKAFDRYKQDYRHYGYGYLNAIPAQHCVLIEMYRAYNNEEWVWAPYYTVHKQLAGLIDIANLVDDRAIRDKALLIARDMGLWVWNRLHYRTYVKKDGTQEERRQRPGNRYEMWNMYIAGEVGGMAESLARLSMMVDDREQSSRLLEAATYFDSPAFFDPLARNVDAIRTRHANQHIPMVTGALKCYEAGASPYYYNIAHNFWHLIQGRYRYATGGVGNGEMFRQPYTQMLSMVGNGEPTLNETCCAYNLAKLTKDLNRFTPDDARLMDYYERVLYNQLVGSLHPREYQVLYQYAVGLDASKPWGNETPQSTCCGGTGAENHVKYQEAAYFANDTALWVALYLPTTATWDAQGVVIRQECNAWPAEQASLRIVKGKGRFALKLRVPFWATEGFSVRLNGKEVSEHYQPCSYVEIPVRRWTKKDVVEVSMPFRNYYDFGPDKLTVGDSGHASWLAAAVKGPMVMTAKNLHTWRDATVTSLGEIASKALIPDYEADTYVTHYFCWDTPAAAPTAVDTMLVEGLLRMAERRIEAQERWQAMEVKVPEFAPWAPHGYARMADLVREARQLLSTTADPVKAEQVAAALNSELNTMRPGHLAEPEDVSRVSELLLRLRTLPQSRERDRVMRYASGVVRYVTNGSGTMDMIRRAEKELNEILK